MSPETIAVCGGSDVEVAEAWQETLKMRGRQKGVNYDNGQGLACCRGSSIIVEAIDNMH